MQGILLWTQNKTMAFLDNCSDTEKEALIKKAARNRKIIQKQYQEKVKTIKQQRHKEVDDRKKAQKKKNASCCLDCYQHRQCYKNKWVYMQNQKMM